MKATNKRNDAQVIPMPKFSETAQPREDETMNKKHISIECYHKLNRSSAVSGYIHSDLMTRPVNGMHQLFIPHLFSYIHDDIAQALQELKEKGLCDQWLRQERDNSDEE